MNETNTVVGGVGMDSVVTDLTTSVSQTQLWAVVGDVVPIVVVGVLFSLGIYFVRKAIKGISKGKARI